MSDILAQAFREVFPQASPVAPCFVTLYRTDRPYGGPEEGGWWYDHTVAVETIRVPSREVAEQLVAKLRSTAREMTNEARRERQEAEARECDWAEARGIEPGDLPEGPGYSRFRVHIETLPGELTTTERPHYC